MKRAIICLVVAFAFLAGLPARALILEVVPASQTINEGDVASVDVVVTDPGGVLIGAFGIILSFDPAVLSPVMPDPVVFGTGLVPSITGVDGSVAGMLAVDELSFTPFLAQTGIDDLLLFTVSFVGLAPGISSIELLPGISEPTGGMSYLGDEFGFPVIPDAVGIGEITVEPPAVAMPEPGSLGLLATAGALLLLGSRRRG